MKNYFIALIFASITSNVFADLTIKTGDSIQDEIDLIQVKDKTKIHLNEDVLAMAINYPSFVMGLKIHGYALNESIKKKEFDLACEYTSMIYEYLVNNIKYAEEYNRDKNKADAYQRLLLIANEDQLKNKKGCDGEEYFIK